MDVNRSDDVTRAFNDVVISFLRCGVCGEIFEPDRVRDRHLPVVATFDSEGKWIGILPCHPECFRSALNQKLKREISTLQLQRPEPQEMLRKLENLVNMLKEYFEKDDKESAILALEDIKFWAEELRRNL